MAIPRKAEPIRRSASKMVFVAVRNEPTKVCQTCWYELRPEVYFPNTDAWGECARCEDYGFIARVRADEIR